LGQLLLVELPVLAGILAVAAAAVAAAALGQPGYGVHDLGDEVPDATAAAAASVTGSTGSATATGLAAAAESTGSASSTSAFSSAGSARAFTRADDVADSDAVVAALSRASSFGSLAAERSLAFSDPFAFAEPSAFGALGAVLTTAAFSAVLCVASAVLRVTACVNSALWHRLAPPFVSLSQRIRSPAPDRKRKMLTPG